MKIEIGGGLSPRNGYINCDVRKLDTVDYVCKANNLPFEDCSLDEIYSRHVVEHFSFKEFLEVLKEWNRVLRIGGKLYIICPNLLWHLEQILSGSHKSFFTKERGKNDRYWGFGSLFGWQQDRFDSHKFGCYFELLLDILTEFNFEKIVNLTGTAESFEKAPWHLEVMAQKSEEILSDIQESYLFHHFDVKH